FSVNGGEWEKRVYAKPKELEGQTMECVSDLEDISKLVIKNTAENYQIKIKSKEAARVMTYPNIIPVLQPDGIENIFQNVVLNYFWKVALDPREEKEITLSVEIKSCK
ncbi:MAG: DUF1926 domain-containing protein, partial [Candidatus Marinimicrobia bacterium]|nr:DUF1926 domain-containing protein [Candidatus Neomarinimicrobiota bacterium]